MADPSGPTHDKTSFVDNTADTKPDRRRWRRALLLSFVAHVLLLGIVLWASQGVEEPVEVTVEFRQSLAASGKSAAPRGITRSQTKTGTATEAQSQANPNPTPARVQNTSASARPSEQVTPERKLELVRRVRSEKSPTTEQSKPLTAQSKPTKANANQVASTNRELALKRSTRYVKPNTSGSLSRSASSASSAAAPAEQGGGAPPGGATGKPASAGAKQGVPTSRVSGIGKKLAESSARAKIGTAGRSASSSFFNWKGGHKERHLLAKEESLLPASVRNQGIRAQTVVKFRVDKNGRSHGIEMIKSSGYHELDDWTTRYVRTFRFNRVQDNFVYQAEYTQFFKP